jgi:hypothetical protein
MFGTWLDFGQDAIETLFLILAACITSCYIYGYGSKKAAETFTLLICILVCSTQLYFLIQAAVTIPGMKFKFENF